MEDLFIDFFQYFYCGWQNVRSMFSLAYCYHLTTILSDQVWAVSSVMAENRKKASIVGIVADVHRHMEGHHYSQWSSVFGISEEEFSALQQ